MFKKRSCIDLRQERNRQMKSLKRAIVEKLGKLNECGGGYYGYHGSSSSGGGSCGGGYSSEPSLKS